MLRSHPYHSTLMSAPGGLSRPSQTLFLTLRTFHLLLATRLNLPRNIDLVPLVSLQPDSSTSEELLAPTKSANLTFARSVSDRGTRVSVWTIVDPDHQRGHRAHSSPVPRSQRRGYVDYNTHPLYHHIICPPLFIHLLCSTNSQPLPPALFLLYIFFICCHGFSFLYNVHFLYPVPTTPQGRLVYVCMCVCVSV